MFPLVIFSLALTVMLFVVDPSPILCSTTLSVGLLDVAARSWYALSLIALFSAIRSRFGFLLLAPSIVSAAMVPEAAVSIMIASAILFMRRYVEWLPFIFIASTVLLSILVGIPLASLVMLALLIPVLSDIPSPVWRIRAIALWIVIFALLVPVLVRYVDSFSLYLLGVQGLPLAPVLFASLAIVSMLSLANDTHARLLRVTLLLLASVLIAPLALFAMPVIVALIARELRFSIGEEHLRGSRFLAGTVIVIALLVPLTEQQGVLEYDDALVFAPDHLELAREGRAYPSRIAPGQLDSLVGVGDPDGIVGVLEELGVRTVVYPSGFDEPIVFALRHAPGVSVQTRDGFTVASLS